jgi:N-acetylmuramoyl-L-alanine amidase
MLESVQGRELVVVLNQEASALSGTAEGGIASWRTAGRSLVFKLDRPMSVARMLTLPPTGSVKAYRLILDLETVSDARFSSKARKDVKRLAKALAEPVSEDRLAGAMASDRRDQRLKRKPGTKYLIAIDAGHGGKDPGTKAANGILEKDITLSAARMLKTLLEQDPTYQVTLTRDADTYVELEDRVTRARNAGADLFISLHADAAKSKEVAGASIYTISARGEQRIDKEAGRNKWIIPIEDGTPEQVSGILEDLVKRETKTRSAEFAEALLPELAKAGPVLRGTHRSAGFYVLLAPDVPAVLLELGFLTHPEDAERLASETGRMRSMHAIRNGIDQYFAAQEKRVASR